MHVYTGLYTGVHQIHRSTLVYTGVYGLHRATQVYTQVYMGMQVYTGNAGLVRQ